METQFDLMMNVYDEHFRDTPMFMGLSFEIFTSQLISHRNDTNVLVLPRTLSCLCEHPCVECLCEVCLCSIFDQFGYTHGGSNQEFEYFQEYFFDLFARWDHVRHFIHIINFIDFVDRVTSFCGDLRNPGVRIKKRRNLTKNKKRKKGKKCATIAPRAQNHKRLAILSFTSVITD